MTDWAPGPGRCVKKFKRFNDVFCSWLVRAFCIWNQSTEDEGGVRRERLAAVGVIDRWKVTCDMSQVACYLWHMTHDFFLYQNYLNYAEGSQKVPKRAIKCERVQKSVKKAEFHSISGTICTRQESRCLPYARFSLNQPHWADSVIESPRLPNTTEVWAKEHNNML